MPNFDNKILFLESLGGDLNKIATFIEQYHQIGAFDKINGILLGEFTELEKNYDSYSIADEFMQDVMGIGYEAKAKFNEILNKLKELR